MKWTNIISGVAKVFLILGIIGSFTGAMILIVAEEELSYAFLFAIGIVVIFISYAGIMMLCEISQNLYEINQEVQKVNSKIDDPAQSTPGEMPQLRQGK